MGTQRAGVLAWAVAALLGGTAWVAMAQGLQVQPAITSSMAARSVMLSVARAGQRLVAVGERGFIIVSDDNGGHWAQVPCPVAVTLVKVRFVDARQGWAVGHAGVVLHTQDGGMTWARQLDGVQAAALELQQVEADGAATQEQLAQARQLVDDGPDKPLLDLLFFDAEHGLVVGAYGLALETRDGGKSWQSIRARIDNPQGLHLYSLQQAGADLFVAGEQGTLWRSSDGGQKFEALTAPYEGTTFGLQATSKGSLLAFGLRGKAYKSQDRGDTWQRLDTLQPITLTSGVALADGTLLLADESGRVLQFAPGATQATLVPVAQPRYFTGMVQAANGDLIISSANSMLAQRVPSGQEQQP